jgi:hypothetical protein
MAHRKNPCGSPLASGLFRITLKNLGWRDNFHGWEPLSWEH